MTRLPVALLALCLAAAAGCGGGSEFPRSDMAVSRPGGVGDPSEPIRPISLVANPVPPSFQRTWLVERIGTADVIDRLNMPLIFAADGRVNGNSGCNRIAATSSVRGSDIAFVEVDTTRRTCSAMLMDQEARLLGALREARGWRSDRGRLLLTGTDGRDVLRLAPR